MSGLRERLADLCHEQWSGWMRYLFDQCSPQDNGSTVIPAWGVTRWVRQMNTIYSELTDEEKEADRKEADRFLNVLAGVTTVITANEFPYAKIWLDGEEVSNRCYAANPEDGWVALVSVRGGGVHIERVCGEVRVELPDD